MTWPLALVICTCTSPATPSKIKGRSAACGGGFVAIGIFGFLNGHAHKALPSDSTVRPIKLLPCSICTVENWLVTLLTVSLSFSMPVTVLICAICEVICALSIGAVGSWFQLGHQQREELVLHIGGVGGTKAVLPIGSAGVPQRCWKSELRT